MTASVERRLAKLEVAKVQQETPGVAEEIQAGRLRAREMPEDVLEAEQRARLEEMREQHAARPLYGLALRMMEGLERTCNI